jgi:DNA-binding transcriptional MerR regulator
VRGHALRAWEGRYGLLRPVRSAGGFRLYSEADALRVRRMQAHLARGLSPPRRRERCSDRTAGAATAGPPGLPPGKLHDLALMVFGIVPHRGGWRIDYLGMDTRSRS